MDLTFRFSHGCGDCVQFATLLQLYKRRGYRVGVKYDLDKIGLWQAAGIPYAPKPAHDHRWPYTGDFNKPRADSDGYGNKVFHNLYTGGLPDLGDRDAIWNELCALDCSDFADRILTAELCDEARQFLADLPRPVVLLHSRGNSFTNEKNIPDGVASDLCRDLLEAMPGSVVLLDWHGRVHHDTDEPRVKNLKRDWGHISVYQLLALMDLSDLLIGIDSGPFHLANFTRTPALGVFHQFYPSCVCLPRPNLNTAYMTFEKHRDINVARQDRWPVLEYTGDWRAGKGTPKGPKADEITRHAVRMLAGPQYGLPLGRDVVVQQLVRDRGVSAATAISKFQNPRG